MRIEETSGGATAEEKPLVGIESPAPTSDEVPSWNRVCHDYLYPIMMFIGVGCGAVIYVGLLFVGALIAVWAFFWLLNGLVWAIHGLYYLLGWVIWPVGIVINGTYDLLFHSQLSPFSGTFTTTQPSAGTPVGVSLTHSTGYTTGSDVRHLAPYMAPIGQPPSVVQVKFNASTVSVLEGKVEGTEVSVVQDTVKESGVAVAGGKAEQAVVPTAARGTDESAGPESGNNLNEGANGVPDGQPIPITVERQAPRRILKTGKLRSLKKVAEAGGWGGN